MHLTKSTLSSVVAGLILGYLGAYLTGYTSAFSMPANFIKFMWVWDILVVQFLGFGVLAILLSYSVAYFSKLNFFFSVIASFVIAQLNLFLMMDGNINLYFPHILTMLTCLIIGWLIAIKRHAEQVVQTEDNHLLKKIKH
ncbi:hypothetical protein Q4506_06615 [Colwellia sp. 4_MG-2023]|jgi:hypothetical protein|uniref:hypothetical protein n=1 Tax=unclassified Colwellia TaxID=196834 RepID=UPI001C097B39|nr:MULTISPECIES: hypothetical protein [unclassified Colwellia]MBU2925844.1 hypothetical protein [Colwellia sp. C2M11]MDO6489125.1 hypothetical protein [Colwellia sp. 6_MG-2023]MDO6508206.1 hypothetical protein [Colwellia sp. 5_MG-2023]MDO6555345.1 hypothetical protein [Colwellia sp. 4_MG-2023]MDO6652759.1 hypothetical protein [Colwellia sp. 3_MG-2023]